MVVNEPPQSTEPSTQPPPPNTNELLKRLEIAVTHLNLNWQLVMNIRQWLILILLGFLAFVSVFFEKENCREISNNPWIYLIPIILIIIFAINEFIALTFTWNTLKAIEQIDKKTLKELKVITTEHHFAKNFIGNIGDAILSIHFWIFYGFLLFIFFSLLTHRFDFLLKLINANIVFNVFIAIFSLIIMIKIILICVNRKKQKSF